MDEPGRGRGGRRVAKVAGAIAFLVLALLVFLPWNVGWTALQKSLHRKFPAVTWIQPPTLEDWLKDSQRAPPVLLDVRTPAEYAVSHLRGARRVEAGAPVSLAVGDLRPDTPIVTYCAVGYRSAVFAGRLQQAGYTNVVVLDGSIFQWANEGRPLYGDHQPVRQVHPYSPLWAGFLNPRLRAWSPGSPAKPAPPGVSLPGNFSDVLGSGFLIGCWCADSRRHPGLVGHPGG